MNHYASKTLEEFKNNAKKTWGIMKELIGKICNTESSLRKNCHEKLVFLV